MKDNSKCFSVKKMAKTLGVSRSSYYAWLKSKPSAHELRDRFLTKEIKNIFYKLGKERFGSPKVYDRLKAMGIKSSEKRVARLMRENSLVAKRSKKFKATTNSSHAYPASPNLLNRDFTTSEPDKVWVSDITYISTAEGWLYLCIILDLYSRKVVGWSMEKHMRADLVIQALNMAVQHRSPEAGLVFHSDQGIQYACKDFRDKIDEYGMIQSMSRKGNCWDNAVAESFFSNLKLEEVFHRKYLTRDEAKKSIFEYIEVFYNRYRPHSSIQYFTPVEFEEYRLENVA